MDKPRALYRESERVYVWIFALACGLLAIVPEIIGFMARPAGNWYMGYQYNMDDHMVYAAWMRQAMEGRFFFDNRFAVDPQPGLTVHLYFWALGQVARLTGIPVATTLARFLFSVLFVHLLYRLLRRSDAPVHTVKVGLALAVFGGGIGFLVWQTFGLLIDPPSAMANAVFLGRLPTDVWQPEGFVFASMLTNSLFMVSLCLILTVFDAFAVSKDSPRAIWRGFLAIGLLMNIHSYDVALIAIASVAWLAMAISQRKMTGAWLGRIALVTLGVVPAALWFVHVLKEDKVFQARAATETYSPNFRAVVFGYLVLLCLGLYGAYRQAGATRRAQAGIAVAVLTILVLSGLATGHTTDSYFAGYPGWLAMLATMIVACVLLAGPSTMLNGFVAWALTGLVAIYLPQLFQRKLMMGMAVPWGVLSAFGVTALLAERERSSRNLATALGLLLMAGSSVRWFLREIQLERLNVSNTTVHKIYLTEDVRRAIQKLGEEPGRKVVLALPGVASRPQDQQGQPIPDAFDSPLISDLNPVAAGFAGAYAYAGHWSETPDYTNRRNDATKIFLAQTPEAERNELLQKTRATHLIAPIPEAFPNLPLIDARRLGDVVMEGSQFALVRLPAAAR